MTPTRDAAQPAPDATPVGAAESAASAAYALRQPRVDVSLGHDHLTAVVSEHCPPVVIITAQQASARS